MCRMVAYFGSSRERVRQLFNCLKEAARNDVYYNSISHSDGWGSVVLTRDKIIHYRDVNPIYTQDFPAFTLNEEMIVVVHARQATDKNLVSSVFSHPYIETNERYIYYLVHNGSVDKERLGKELGVNPERMVDSELLLKYISLKGDSEKEIERLKEYTKSSLNFILLKIERNRKASLYVINYYNTEHIKSKRINEKYYALYYVNREGSAVYSSTVGYYCNEDGEELEKGRLIKIGEMYIR